jgi:hypothetical protein
MTVFCGASVQPGNGSEVVNLPSCLMESLTPALLNACNCTVARMIVDIKWACQGCVNSYVVFEIIIQVLVALRLPRTLAIALVSSWVIVLVQQRPPESAKRAHFAAVPRFLFAKVHPPFTRSPVNDVVGMRIVSVPFTGNSPSHHFAIAQGCAMCVGNTASRSLSEHE